LLGYYFSPLLLPLATLSTRRSRYKISAAPEGGGIAHLEESIPSMSLYTSPAKLTISRESNLSKQSHNTICALTERARIRADESTIRDYSSHIEDCLFDLEHHPDSECSLNGHVNICFCARIHLATTILQLQRSGKSSSVFQSGDVQVRLGYAACRKAKFGPTFTKKLLLVAI
jgi:hypothetical protein